MSVLSDLSAETGHSVGDLRLVIGAGVARVALNRLQNVAIPSARAHSEALLAADRQALATMQASLAAREAQHAGVIARMEAVLGELNAGVRSEGIDVDAMIAEMI
ncbi:MAG: hypothetical protein V4710_19690 [Verrucomicrobiota bacterium]